MENIKLPAGIDLHVHFREPGFEYKETMKTGLEAARAGGIATVIDMPNANPPTDSPEAMESKMKLASAYPGIHLAAGLTDLSVKKKYISNLRTKTPIFKVFLAESTGNMRISEENFLIGLEQLNQEPSLLMIHAEKSELIKPRTHNSDELIVRPIKAEVESIKWVQKLASKFDNIKFHITHVSTGQGASILADQKEISWDVLAKFISFTTDLVAEKGNFAKMNPPLRMKSDLQTLLELMKENKIPIITSDHAPHTIEEKNNKQTIVAGAPGVQETYLVLIDLYLRGKISKPTLENMIYRNPAKLLNDFGLGHVKGDIEVAIDQKNSFDKNQIRSKCGWSLWENYEFQGKIIKYNF